jgi:hypothetical protein
MVGAAVELEPDMNSSLVAGGTATRERVNLELDASDCDDVRDSTSRSRPLSKEPRWNS